MQTVKAKIVSVNAATNHYEQIAVVEYRDWLFLKTDCAKNNFGQLLKVGQEVYVNVYEFFTSEVVGLANRKEVSHAQ